MAHTQANSSATLPLMSISDDEHKRFIRGELSLLSVRMKWAVACLAVIGVSAALIAIEILSR